MKIYEKVMIFYWVINRKKKCLFSPDTACSRHPCCNICSLKMRLVFSKDVLKLKHQTSSSDKTKVLEGFRKLKAELSFIRTPLSLHCPSSIKQMKTYVKSEWENTVNNKEMCLRKKITKRISQYIVSIFYL